MKNVAITAIVTAILVLSGCVDETDHHSGACGNRTCVRRAAERKHRELCIPDPNFTDRVQISLKGVVHIQTSGSTGSGFVVGPRLIATARHMVVGVEDFVITTHDGHQLRATRAISDKEHDVAFLWVDNLECVAEERGTVVHDGVLHPIPIGSIKGVKLLQSVYVIGSPYGKLNFNSATMGHISGLKRDYSSLGVDYGWEVAFTTTSPGAPGNSGGPVFTLDGVVRGILVGGFNPTLICVMPCDLFIADLDGIRAMFLADKYEREEVADHVDDSYYSEEFDPEYY